jgi:type IV secretory pathway component VirB8
MRKDDLTVDEATAIAENARSGSLSLEDPEVRKVVEQANRVLVRAQMWGEDRSPKLRRRRRIIAIGALVMVLVWVAGLLVPLAVRFA